MAELTITVRDGADADLLATLADARFRFPEQQASALLAEALNAQRRRDSPDNKRGPRRAVATNGVSGARVPAHS